MNLNVYLSYKFYPKESESAVCIKVRKNIMKFSYEAIKCNDPYPVGRHMIITGAYISKLSLTEFEAYGTKFECKDAKQLNSISVDMNNSSFLIEAEKASYPSKIIDGCYENKFINPDLSSCSMVKHSIESRISVELEKVSWVYQVVIIGKLHKGIFIDYVIYSNIYISALTYIDRMKSVLITVEIESRTPERQICGILVDNDVITSYVWYMNCSLVGNVVSLYKSNHNNVENEISLCEIIIFGKELNEGEG